MLQCRTKNRNIHYYTNRIIHHQQYFDSKFSIQYIKSYYILFSMWQVNCLWKVKYIYDKGQTRSGDLLFGCQKNPIKKQRGGSRIRINQRSCMCIFMEKQSSFFMNIQYKGGEKEKGGPFKRPVILWEQTTTGLSMYIYI